jgi:hypothetical protein
MNTPVARSDSVGAGVLSETRILIPRRQVGN